MILGILATGCDSNKIQEELDEKVKNRDNLLENLKSTKQSRAYTEEEIERKKKFLENQEQRITTAMDRATQAPGNKKTTT